MSYALLANSGEVAAPIPAEAAESERTLLLPPCSTEDTDSQSEASKRENRDFKGPQAYFAIDDVTRSQYAFITAKLCWAELASVIASNRLTMLAFQEKQVD